MRIGIDLGGTKIEGILMDDHLNTISRIRRLTSQDRGYEAIIETIYQIINELESRVGQTCPIGIGTPGSISPRTQLIKNSNTLCLIDKPLKQDLELSLQREIRIQNDANCFALSEARDGAGEGYSVVFGVIMGTGVGGGIVINNTLHAGPHRIAGEWGHNVLEANGPECYCGNNGCVETFLSGPGLVNDYLGLGGDLNLDAKTILERAEQGDEYATEAQTRFLHSFGKAIAMVINILDPDVVILGGGLSNHRQLYTQGREQISRHVFSPTFNTPVVENLHGDSSGVRGAAMLWSQDGT